MEVGKETSSILPKIFRVDGVPKSSSVRTKNTTSTPKKLGDEGQEGAPAIPHLPCCSQAQASLPMADVCQACSYRAEVIP